MTVSEHTIERLLTEAHAAAGPSSEQRLRALRRLESGLGSPPLLPPSSLGGAGRLPDGGGPAPPAAAVGTGFSHWAAAGVVAALLGIAAGYGLLRRSAVPTQPLARGSSGSEAPRSAPTDSARAQPAPMSAVLPAAAEPAPPSAEEPSRLRAAEADNAFSAGLPSARRGGPSVPGSSSAPRHAQQPSSAAPDLREALALLREAQRELSAHHADRAMAKLAELEARSPELLVEERETTRVLAWCERGEPERARALARALRAAHPDSVYQQRLASSCAANADSQRVLEEIRRRAPN